MTAMRAALESAGLSQLAGARLLGVDPRTVRKWCLGERPVNPHALRLLLIYTDQDPEYGPRVPDGGR